MGVGINLGWWRVEEIVSLVWNFRIYWFVSIKWIVSDVSLVVGLGGVFV